jgi:hypothetical protein
VTAPQRLQPFGTPEGSRADISELSDDRFVGFGGNIARFGGLAIPASDLSGRVFVGCKGAGKTVYLRRAQAFAQDQDELFADEIRQELPTTTQVFSVSRWFAPAVLTQVWMSIWRVAILRSLFSFLAHEPRLENGSTETFREQILKDYGSRLPEQPDPMHVYSQARAIIRSHAGIERGEELLTYIEHEDWDAIEGRLARQLTMSRPVCFYLDAIDEEFRHAPTHWLMCQRGLFFQVMRFLRIPRLGGRLHIVISIRDLVYSSVMQSEHLTRYVDSERVRLLEWNVESVAYLLEAKVAQVEPRLFTRRPGVETPLGEWLGYEMIRNEKRDVVERLQHYLLRHTRLIPRDIVILLNMLHLRAGEAVARGEQVEEEVVRRVVSQAAKLFGTEQLAIAGNQLAMGYLPREAVEHDFVELLTGAHPLGLSEEARVAPGITFMASEQRYVYQGLDTYDGTHPELVAAAAYQRGILEDLTALVAAIGVDRFSGADFDVAEVDAEARFAGGRALSVLWQNGLLGYTEGDVDTGAGVFYTATRIDPLDVPRGKPGYVLHPCLIDAVSLRSRGAPILPFPI